MHVLAKQGLSHLHKKIIGTLLIAILAIVFTISYGYSISSQSNQTDNTVANSPSSEPIPAPEITPTPSPEPTQTPETSSALESSVTTTTYGGTTLVCYGRLSLRDDGGPMFIMNSVKITNIGAATAYRVNLRIQAYYPEGTKAADVTKTLDASGIYSPFPEHVFLPVNIAPGQTMTFPNSGRDGAYEVHGQIPLDDSILGNYTITPVWSIAP
jgi:hypothetical protein